MSILVMNAGSSTLKFSCYDASATESLASGVVDWGGRETEADLSIRYVGDPRAENTRVEVAGLGEAAVQVIRTVLETDRIEGEIDAVGHRVVHGGEAFNESTRINAEVEAEIRRLCSIAPLHNPPALAAIEAAQRALPNIPQVAVFDTAFFARLPAEAYIYALPYEWYEKWGVRRFGFHGTSHAYCTQMASEMLDRSDDDFRVITCHLGNGCSASAARGGQSVATTMGFTPLEGLMMGTRGGTVDPGILVFALREAGFSAEELDRVLNRESGLLGVSGVSSDYREVEQAAEAGNERARLALDIYARRVRSTVGHLAADLGGLDALVFTAGVGEHSAALRRAVCANLGFLGIELDPVRNEDCTADAAIGVAGAATEVLIIHTRENLRIARETRRVATGE